MLQLSLALATIVTTPGQDGSFGDFLTKAERATARYRDAIERAANMVQDSPSQRLVQSQGLHLLNLTWEDTGRYKNSSVGPNISDLTIQVVKPSADEERQEAALMPVVRFPNFEDKTGDMDPRDFTLLVGNHRGRALTRVSLREFLARPGDFMSRPREWPSRERTLLADRDEKVLVSAQACLLPVPQGEKATFNPVLFNYQSRPGDPAVLAILATRQGTSMTIIDNQRNGFSSGWGWGQRLFHNANGQRASLTGERMSDFLVGPEAGAANDPKVSESGLSMVLLVQVPLQQRERERRDSMSQPSAPAGGTGSAKAESRGMEAAVIGHGELEGPFVETDGLSITRDPRFPVRVTVQFYKATDSGRLTESDVRQIKRDLDRVYRSATSVGSLVTGGRTGRPTEYDGPKVQPKDWWERFWRDYESWSGVSRDVAKRNLVRALGTGYMDKPVTELYLRDLLR
ncbi:MAG: hypothetical protein KF884_05835 [Fimbriimonadaceae bacterium]|nr:MAG: hypothetical protein KF884_05835 [Fimbriimonadaceae bacterium]